MNGWERGWKGRSDGDFFIFFPLRSLDAPPFTTMVVECFPCEATIIEWMIFNEAFFYLLEFSDFCAVQNLFNQAVWYRSFSVRRPHPHRQLSYRIIHYYRINPVLSEFFFFSYRFLHNIWGWAGGLGVVGVRLYLCGCNKRRESVE